MSTKRSLGRRSVRSSGTSIPGSSIDDEVSDQFRRRSPRQSTIIRITSPTSTQSSVTSGRGSLGVKRKSRTPCLLTPSRSTSQNTRRLLNKRERELRAPVQRVPETSTSGFGGGAGGGGVGSVSFEATSESGRLTMPSLDPSDLHKIKVMQTSLSSEERRVTMARVTFSLSQLSGLIRFQREVAKNLPDARRKTIVVRNLPESGSSGALITAVTDSKAKEVERDFYRRLQEAAAKRKSLKIMRRWFIAYRKVQSVLTICRNMAERSQSFEVSPQTYVDIGDTAVVSRVDYGQGRSIDPEQFKRRKEISISSRAKDILLSDPMDRTLIQIEDARRELQKVDVFSKYPIFVQEQLISRAHYLTIGPKRIIIRQGHMPLHFYIIISGDAYAREREIDLKTLTSSAKTIGFLKTGDTFGSASLMSGTFRGVTVISRTSMQLLAIHGDDYLEMFLQPALSQELPPHFVYLSGMTFMEKFPIEALRESLSLCTLHHFRRNTVITHDSMRNPNLYIIKYGYCKVFRKLDWVDRSAADIALSERRKVANQRKVSVVVENMGNEDEEYIERDSPYVNYIETLSPTGKTVRMPVTKIPRNTDKLQNIPLKLPGGKRQFLPLMLLREGEVFGLDQTPLCSSQPQSKTVILVSLGAEVIALNKNLYCRLANKVSREVVERCLIYDSAFIRRRLKERVNRDVHLEEVLSHYFTKLANYKANVSKLDVVEEL